MNTAQRIAHEILVNKGWKLIHTDSVHSLYINEKYPGHFIRNDNRVVYLTMTNGYSTQTENSSHRRVDHLLNSYYRD